MTTQYNPTAPTGYHPNGHVNGRGPTGAPLPSPLGRGLDPRGERLPKVRRPRRPGLAAGGVVLVLLCGVTGAAIATAGDEQLGVLALARDVQAGQVLSAEDLKVAHISGSGVSAF